MFPSSEKVKLLVYLSKTRCADE